MDYGDGGPESQLKGNFTTLTNTYKHDYGKLGTFTFKINCSNALLPAGSVLMRSVAVGVNVGTVKVKASKYYLNVGEEVSLTVDTSGGSWVKYVWGFAVTYMGTSSVNVARTLAPWRAPDTYSVTKTFTSPGNHTVTLTASNDLNTVTASMEGKLIVQFPVKEIAVTAPTFVKYPTGTVQFTMENRNAANPPTDVFCTPNVTSGVATSWFAGPLSTPAIFKVSHTYPESFVGTNYISVNCSNFISSYASSVAFTLQRELEDLTVEISKINIQTNEAFNLTIALSQGSHVNFTIDFGDGNTRVAHPENILKSNAPVNLVYKYATNGNRTIKITAANNVSSLVKTKSVVVQNALRSLTLSTNSPVMVPGSILYTLVVPQEYPAPDNVFLSWVHGDGKKSSSFVKSLSTTQPYTESHAVDGSGVTVITTNLTAHNLVSNLNLTTVIKVLSQVKGATLAILTIPNTTESGKLYGKTGSTVHFYAGVASGTGVAFKFALNEEKTIVVSNNGSHAYRTYTFNTPGPKAISVNASNDVSSQIATPEKSFTVQNPVRNVEIHAVNHVAIPDGQFTVTLKLDAGVPLPSDAKASWSLSPSAKGTEDIKAWPYTIKHVYSSEEIGLQDISVNISNMISKQSLSAKVTVIGKLAKGEILAKSALVNTLANVTLSFQGGSHADVSLDFGDSASEKKAFPGEIGQWVTQHKYTSIGYYQLKAVASNQFGTETVSGPRLHIAHSTEGIKMKPIPNLKYPDEKLVVEISNHDLTKPLDKITVNVDYGDETPKGTNNGDLVNAGDVIKLDHQYAKPGNYAIVVTIENGASSHMITEAVMVYGPLGELKISAKKSNGEMIDLAKETISLNTELTFSFTSDQKGLTAKWHFHDGTLINRLTGTFLFQKEGTFDVTLVASNPKYTKRIMVSCTVLGKFLLTSSESPKPKSPMNISAVLKSTADNACFMFAFGDASKNQVLGFPIAYCKKHTPNAEAEYHSAPKAGSVNATHVFIKEGSYNVRVVYFDEFTRENKSLKVGVGISICHAPLITYSGAGALISSPRIYTRAQAFKLSSSEFKTELRCSSEVEVIWLMYNLTTSQESPVDIHGIEGIEQAVSQIAFRKKSLPYGLYRMVFRVAVKESPTLSAQANVYVKIEGSPITCGIIGGSLRTVGLGTKVLIDGATMTSDPDVNVNKASDFTYQWYCKKDAESMDISGSVAVIDLPIPGTYLYLL